MNTPWILRPEECRPRVRAVKRGIGSFAPPNGREFDTWLTPPAIVRALGLFDLDPCAAPSPRPWDTAIQHIALPNDGLSSPWSGRVWLNPPYGRALGAWLEKMAGHRSGISLTFARTETEAWQRWVWPIAKAVLFIAGRLSFCLPDGTQTKGTSGGPSALIAYTDFDAQALRQSGISGALTSVEHWRRP